jgi:hypothetical protein
MTHHSLCKVALWYTPEVAQVIGVASMLELNHDLLFEAEIMQPIEYRTKYIEEGTSCRLTLVTTIHDQDKRDLYTLVLDLPETL